MIRRFPLGWGLDENGEETDDPSKVAAILPAAGPKGSALAIIMDVLCGPLGGGLMGINKAYNPRNAPPEKIATSHFFFAINIANLTSVDEFKEEMDEQIRTTRKAKPRRGIRSRYASRRSRMGAHPRTSGERYSAP